MTHTITREFLRQQRACYFDEPNGEAKVNALVPPEGLTPLQIARLDIPEPDRIWVLTRKGVLADCILWEWAARTVEREIGRLKALDPRSLAVVPLLRRLASGEKVSRVEIVAIRSAAHAAYADADAAAAHAAHAAARAAHATAAAAERSEPSSQALAHFTKDGSEYCFRAQ